MGLKPWESDDGSSLARRFQRGTEGIVFGIDRESSDVRGKNAGACATAAVLWVRDAREVLIFMLSREIATFCRSAQIGVALSKR
jgi:hypothetical protein